jgi:hypothetical protein
MSDKEKIDFVCIQESNFGGQRFGVFREIHPISGNVRWIIAKVPASWKDARSTRMAPPPPDGNGVEKPASLLAPFITEDQALKLFERWSINR